MHPTMRFSVFSPSFPNEFFTQLSDALDGNVEFNVIKQDKLGDLAEEHPLLFMDKPHGNEKISQKKPEELKDCKARIIGAFYFSQEADKTMHRVEWSDHLVRTYCHNGSQLIDVAFFKSNLEEVFKIYTSYQDNLKKLQIEAAPADEGLIQTLSRSLCRRNSINKIAAVVFVFGTIYTAFKSPQNLSKFATVWSIATITYNTISHLFTDSMHALHDDPA